MWGLREAWRTASAPPPDRNSLSEEGQSAGSASAGLPNHVKVAARVLTLEVALSEVIQELSGRVPCILLKGPSIAHWLYDSPLERLYGDGDLLVSPDRVESAKAILRGLGFTTDSFTEVPGDRVAPSSEWSRGDGVFVDLHFTLAGIQAPPETVWSVFARNSEKMKIRGVEATILAIPARALHVTLHAAQHGLSASQPVVDLQRAIQRVDEKSWRDAVKIAQEVDAASAMSAGLRLIPEGASLADSLGLPPPTKTDDILRATSAPKAAFNIQTFVELPGLLPKLRFVFRKIVPPVSFMRNRSSLARRGTWGLIAAYAARPLVVMMGSISGLRGWLIARKASKSPR